VKVEWILEYPLGVKVTWSHAYKAIPWYLLGLYFKISDKHTYNFIWEHPHHPRNEDSDLFRWIHLMGKTISIDWFSTVWSLLVSSLPDRFQTILKWFRKRFFFLFFFATRLWQSVTLLISDIRSSVKANNQTKTKIESTTFNYFHHGLGYVTK